MSSQTSVVLRSSGSSQGSIKRKSFEDENDENAITNTKETKEPTPSNVSKKTKTHSSDVASVSSQPASKVKSALPRYQAQLPKASVTATSKKVVASTPSEKKRLVTEQNTIERVVSNTPHKLSTPYKSTNSRAPVLSQLSSPTPSLDANSIIRRIKRSIANVTGGDGVQNLFEGAFSVNEERIVSIMANLRVKSKWDMKEKSKKQDAVIKELRDCLTTMFSEAKALREGCVGGESFNTSLLQDALEELQTASVALNQFKASDLRLKQDLQKTQEELVRATSGFATYRAECSPLKSRAKDCEAQLSAATEKLYREEMRGIQLAAELARVQKELTDFKEKMADALTTQKEQAEQRLEQSVAGYRDEVSIMRAELAKKQTDTEQARCERADVDRRKGELAEELILTQSKLRESENAARRSEAELQRACADLSYLKEQLSAKDSDLRAALNSLSDIQKQSFEDKASLRTELSTLQARAQSLEDARVDLTARLSARNEEHAAQIRDITQLREALAQLEVKLATKECEAATAKEAIAQLALERDQRIKAEVREENERRERIASTSQLVATKTECADQLRETEAKAAATVDALRMELAVAAHQQVEAQEVRRQLENDIVGLESIIKDQKIALEKTDVDREKLEAVTAVNASLAVSQRETADLLEQLAELRRADEEKMAEYESKLIAGEVQRRKLHNLVQELRGNIRVFARVRPFLPNDQTPDGAESTIVVKPDVNTLRICKSATEDERAEEHSFAFDKVFGPSASQEMLFQEVSEFVQSALDGYNVCLFSYGQTGSGKTHTMQGSGSGSMRGIIPRAMQQVGLYKNQLEAKGWQYHMQVSFVEIYNETIRDLLRVGGRADEPAKTHDIKKDAAGNVSITDVEMVDVDPNDTAQIDGIMELAARHRSTSRTDMNEQSSRSHSVFALHLRATNVSQGIVLKGTLSLVDLAGSERLDRSNASGSQMKETCAINKSLSALTDVFVAIANKQPHVPFRNSKLTYLLQPALSGDGKTLMMVNLSPTEESFYESLCSLRLAKQVNQCELGKPKKQLRDVKETKEPSASIANSSLSTSTPSRPKNTLSASTGNIATVLSGATGQSLSASMGSRKTPSASAGGKTAQHVAKRPNLTKK